MIYLGLDDFNEKVNNLDLLWRLNDYFDDFKVNLFTIPARTPTRFLKYVSGLKWIKICVHGYRHVHNETISVKRLRELVKAGYSKVYRPPNFELPGGMEKSLADEGFLVVNGFTWNIKDPAPESGEGWGHIYPHDYRSINGNRGDSLHRFYKNILSLPKNTKFGFYEDKPITQQA